SNSQAERFVGEIQMEADIERRILLRQFDSRFERSSVHHQACAGDDAVAVSMHDGVIDPFGQPEIVRRNDESSNNAISPSRVQIASRATLPCARYRTTPRRRRQPDREKAAARGAGADAAPAAPAPAPTVRERT